MPSGSLETPENDDWGPLSSLPGNPIMWILIGSELAVFGAAIIGFSFARMGMPELFSTSQDHLNRMAGAINTMVLLTSGACAGLALRARLDDDIAKTRLWISAANVLGMIFLAVKFTEYAETIEAGINIDSNDFFMFYFLLTGFHALHVVLGIIILTIVAIRPARDNIITGTAFWHMVDLIWVFIFPVIYLMR